MKPIILAGLFAFALTGIAAAQPEALTPPPVSDEALAAKLASAAEIADQDRRSNALNIEVNRRNREVQARNDAAKAAYDKSLADYHGQIAAQEAANAKVQADYRKQVEAWKADVAACQAGDAKRCGPPAPETRTAAKAPSGKSAAP